MRSTSVRTHTVRDSISAVVCQAQAFVSHSAHKPIHIYAKYLYGNFMQISQPHTHTQTAKSRLSRAPDGRSAYCSGGASIFAPNELQVIGLT